MISSLVLSMSGPWEVDLRSNIFTYENNETAHCHCPTGFTFILTYFRLLFSPSIIQYIHQTLEEQQELNKCKRVQVNFPIMKITNKSEFWKCLIC